jgi:hypothetical protein
MLDDSSIRWHEDPSWQPAMWANPPRLSGNRRVDAALATASLAEHLATRMTGSWSARRALDGSGKARSSSQEPTV